MRFWFQRVGQWLWFPATAFAGAGLFGLADLQEAQWPGRLLLVFPHLAGVALTAWSGRRQRWAGVVALCGCAIMAGLSWWDALDRETGGFEWRFNNALSGAICCAANWVILLFVTCISM